MQSEVQYLDIALAQQNQVVRLREELASDLQSGLKKNGHTPSDFLRKGFIHPACSQIYVSGLTYRPAPGFSYETVAWANSWDTRSLRELINCGGKTLRHSPQEDVGETLALRQPSFMTWSKRRTGPHEMLGEC